MNGNLVPIQNVSIERTASNAVLEAFLNTLDSPETKRAYRHEVGLALVEWTDLGAVTAVELTEHRERWVSRLDDHRTDRLSPSAVLRHLAAVRSFLRFARLTNQVRLTHEMITYTLKSPKATVIRPYQVLTHDERDQLIGAARANLRDRVLLEFALATGLRASEITGIQVGDLTVDEQGDLILRVRQGKGRKDRVVPISRDAESIVRVYLSARKMRLGSDKHAGEYLFASRKGKGHGRLSTARLRQIVDQYVAAAGIEKPISPHSTRHTAAITWLRGGADVTAIQKILGHASLTTTQKYVDHLGMDELKAVVNVGA